MENSLDWDEYYVYKGPVTELKTKIKALETENAALKQKLNMIYPDWRSYYKGFNTILSKEESSYFTYTYNTEYTELVFEIDETKFDIYLFSEYLCIFRDLDNKPHYLHYNSVEERLYELDYIYGFQNEGSLGSECQFKLNHLNTSGSLNFEVVYAKK